MSVCLGWTWAQIDEMTVPQLNEFTQYWRENPPLHIMVANYLGYAKPKKTETGDLGELMAMFPAK